MSTPTARQRPVPTAPAAGAKRRPYHLPVSRLWFMQSRAYFLFLVRELTSLFVAAYALFLIYAIYQVGQGPAEYAGLLEWLRSPVSIVFHLIVLLLVLYHTITWFNLTPKIMVVRLGEEQLTPLLVAAAVYAGWIAVSAAIIWVVLRA